MARANLGPPFPVQVHGRRPTPAFLPMLFARRVVHRSTSPPCAQWSLTWPLGFRRKNTPRTFGGGVRLVRFCFFSRPLTTSSTWPPPTPRGSRLPVCVRCPLSPPCPLRGPLGLWWPCEQLHQRQYSGLGQSLQGGQPGSVRPSSKRALTHRPRPPLGQGTLTQPPDGPPCSQLLTYRLMSHAIPKYSTGLAPVKR